MAPFPETEIMTIKRLEVALRKMDFKLLKDGAYKLHEKYHSGFKFEYLDLLKDLFLDISNNASIPEDIKDILTPTIEDILSSQGIKTDTSTSPYEAMNHNRVSSLTSLTYNTTQKVQEETKLNAFDAFGTNQTAQSLHPQKVFTQSPFSAEPFKEVNTVQNSYINQSNLQVQPNEQQPSLSPIEQENNKEIEQQSEKQTEQTTIQATTEPVITNQNVKEEIKKEPKSVSIFYSQDSSNEKIKNIIRYRDLISKIKDEHISINDILALISEINTQSNTNVLELKSLLEQLKEKENKVSFVTNSISSNLTKLLKDNDVEYNMFNSDKKTNIEFLPIFGLTNLFKCSQCSQEYLDENEKITPLIYQCPKCKNIMLPDFYTTTGANCEINIDYYNQALISLANSKVWLIIHPSLEEKLTTNLLRSALIMNNQIEEIFIVDKDINVQETYKNMFQNIKNDVKISTQMNTTEDFYNSIK